MIIEADGFKRIEGFDRWQDGLYATYENTVLLHEQVRELREAFDRLLQKLQRGKTDEH
jgi:hypothetical protein